MRLLVIYYNHLLIHDFLVSSEHSVVNEGCCYGIRCLPSVQQRLQNEVDGVYPYLWMWL